MPRRIFEGDSEDSKESWRRIRALRSRPPTWMPESRKQLFVSALEQAEQQFKAAEHIGYESRSLNLYYGLSQAGRAISAALTPTDKTTSPEVRGHGLKLLQLDSLKADALFSCEVRGDGGTDSSFGRLAWLLNSDPLKTPVSLAAIWNMVLEVSLDFPQPNYPLPLFVNRVYDGSLPGQYSRRHFSIPLSEQDAEKNGAAIKRQYPDLEPALLLTTTGNGEHIDNEGVRLDLAKFELENFELHLRGYRRSTVLMPSVVPGQKSLDPILSWWVLLYGLSMITRYKPVVWTQAVDVNQSHHAVPLETVLSKASDALPDQILSLLNRPPR
ncbi:YaaC family protein [Arthrobacter agilis]|uniref:YaaC family protein n=1 Tax=Arthrobacter agilis TaxID=37921 RepID=UPI002784F2AD|nr:hypothetical protein [Arthrobacter agilis]